MNPTSGYPASFTSSEFLPDQLIAGGIIRSKKITLLSGENRTRGAVLGKQVGAAAAAAFAGNTGNGAMGAVTVGAGVKTGVYKLVCIEPAANAGKFSLEDPDGIIVGIVTVAVAFAGPLAFTLADGAADFVAGDGFDITVAAGTKYKLAVAAATDGSQTPDLILAEDCDASAADKECMAYVTGDFNTGELTLGAGHTVASITEGLRHKGIHLITPAISA